MFRNFAINLFSKNEQIISSGISAEDHAAALDKLLEKLSLSEEAKTNALTELAKNKSDLTSIHKLVSAFLKEIFQEEIPQEQFATTFFNLILQWQISGSRIDALSASRNLTPLVDELRKEAKRAHATGDIAEAIRLMDEIDAEERSAERKLLEHKQEIEEEMLTRRQSHIGTKEVQISLALASLNPVEAARHIVELTDLSEEDTAKRFVMMQDKQNEHYVSGRDNGLNVDLKVSIEIAQTIVERAQDNNERGSALNIFAISLKVLGERESGTGRLKDAVAAYRAALKEWPRKRVPFDWAKTQNNLGNALRALGERESGTTRLEQAIAAYHEALKVRTRENVPLDWAMTQNNLGTALKTLGERENSTVLLEQAVATYNLALIERKPQLVPREWATTQNNLGTALRALGEQENNTALLKQAVAAYHDALKVRTREKVPLDWAITQNNLGNALRALGEQENNTALLEQAVAACLAALTELKRERVPLDWAMAQDNLANALRALGERESGTTRLEQAVAAYHDALKVRTREKVPLDWAITQNNLGDALFKLGGREGVAARLEEAVTAYRAALEEWTHERFPEWHDIAQQNLASCRASLEQRRKA